jgi:N-acetylmuramoyl-L-alanine amidase
MATRHLVKQGETLARIARRYGLRSADLLKQHDGNKKLLEQRSDPNILHPRDLVQIPDLDPGSEDCASDQRHRFRLHQERPLLRVRLLDDEGEPLAGRPYRLEFADNVIEDEIPDDGVVEQEVPLACERARLTLWVRGDPAGPGTTYDLRIGNLDPQDEMTGVQTRLNNLGLFDGQIDGNDSDELAHAIIIFRKRHDLGDSDQIDDELIAKLESEHGS